MVVFNKVNFSKSYFGKREDFERYIVDIFLKFMFYIDYFLLIGEFEF